MKILYIITKSNWGGAQRNVFDLAVAMKEKGHNVSVALGGDGTLRQRLEDAGIKTHSIATLSRDISVGKDAGSFKEIFSIIKREKPDILHLHSPKAAGLGALSGWLLRIRSIVYTVHGWTFNESRPLPQKVLIVFFSWLTMILSKKIIILSEREYNQTLRFPFITEKKLSLIPSGIKPPVFISVDGARQHIAKNIGLPFNELNSKTVIGTIAELHQNKGLNYLVNAMRMVVEKYPNAICVIVGDGQEREALGNLVKERNLEQYVFFTGYMENAFEYLKAFNIFILPSLKEGLPYVLLEAGCASLPVVATNVGGIPEIAEDMKSGALVQPKNARELAHAISFMIEHPVLRRQYGAALRERVIERFGMERMIEEVNNLYLK